MSPLIQYTSFLIRIWRYADPTAGGNPGAWQGEVEHIQSNRGWSFDSLEALLAFLQQQVERTETLAPTEEEARLYSGNLTGMETRQACTTKRER